MSNVERTPIGIEGLDALIEGGVPVNSSILLAGPAGSGKTTLSIEFLYKGATLYEDHGLYVSFEETTEEIIKNLPFPWNLAEMINSGAILVVKYDPYQYEDIIDLIRSSVKENNARRVVVDSITALNLYVNEVRDVRKLIVDMNNQLQKLGCTSIYTGEVKSETPEQISRFGVEEFICDGILELFLSAQNGELVNKILVRKMRATNHDKKIHQFVFGENGIEVYSSDTKRSYSSRYEKVVY